MRNWVFTILACLSGLVALSSAKAAEPGEFVTVLAGRKPVAGKTFACFTRSYDPAWFAIHSFQRISAVRLLVAVNSASDYGFQLRLGLNLRERSDALATGAECTRKQTPLSLDQPAVCGGEGGGHATISIESKDVVRLGLSTFGRLPPKGAAFVEDDENFQLTRAPLAKCADQAENAQEKALFDSDR
jgi:hypothetical protein